MDGKIGTMTVEISIHAPRTGSDAEYLGLFDAKKEFQSTLPVRGATLPERHHGSAPLISIHAPRTGSDYPSR